MAHSLRDLVQPPPSETAADRLEAALALFDTGLDLVRAGLRREHSPRRPPRPSGQARAMRASRAATAAVLLSSLACSGFMGDIENNGPPAVDRIGDIAGTPVPPGAADARTLETTSIDWILNGELSLPRTAAEPWFDSLQLPCDQPTNETPTSPPFLRSLGDEHRWQSPTDASWRTRSCESSGYSGPHYAVSITAEGEPAWIWVHGLTM
jgi:hypothetical protein